MIIQSLTKHYMEDKTRQEWRFGMAALHNIVGTGLAYTMG